MASRYYHYLKATGEYAGASINALDDNRGSTELPAPEQQEGHASPVFVDGEWRARLDINSATAEQLVEVSGIGESIAEEIVAGRPWAELSELSSISGVSEAMAEGWADTLAAVSLVNIAE